MKKVAVILWKQSKDIWRNKEVLIQFLLFPCMALIMEGTIKLPDMPERFFTMLFAVMYIGMAPLVSMSSLVAEEREKNTLRVLLFADVRPGEYLLGTGSYVWMICMLGSCLLVLAGGFQGQAAVQFLGIMGIGILPSLLLGAAVGMGSRNQVAATSLTVPVMMVLAFLPMIAMFNEQVAKISRFLYTRRLHQLLADFGQRKMGGDDMMVLLINMGAALVLFLIAYKRLKREF